MHGTLCIRAAAAASSHAETTATEGAVPSKKTQRAIAAADVSRVLDDARTDRLAELLARLPAEARSDIEYLIEQYLSGRKIRGERPHFDIPPEFEQLRKAAVALASDLRRVSIVWTVP